MYWDITSAEYVDSYRIRVQFRNGKSGVVDLKPLIDRGGVKRGLVCLAFKTKG